MLLWDMKDVFQIGFVNPFKRMSENVSAQYSLAVWALAVKNKKSITLNHILAGKAIGIKTMDGIQ